MRAILGLVLAGATACAHPPPLPPKCATEVAPATGTAGGTRFVEVHSEDVDEVAVVAAAARHLEYLVGCRLWTDTAAVPPEPIIGHPHLPGVVQVWPMTREGFWAVLEEVHGMTPEEAAGYWGWAWRAKVAVAVDIDRFDYRYAIVLHELGHALGLDHLDTEQVGNIMRPSPAGGRGLTQEQIDQLRGKCLD